MSFKNIIFINRNNSNKKKKKKKTIFFKKKIDDKAAVLANLTIHLSFKIQVDSKGGKRKPSICMYMTGK